MKINDVLTESPQLCPECGGPAFSDLLLAEKKDACYHKVKATAKVWPSAYASGRLVQCRKKGAANWGNKSEGVAEGSQQTTFTNEELDAINQYLDDNLSFQALRTYPGLIRKIASHLDITSVQGHSGEMDFYDRLVQAREQGDIPKPDMAEGSVTKKPQPYNDPNWTKKLTKDQLDALAVPRYNTDKKKQGDDVWGPQGRFAGDVKTDVGGVSMKKMQPGDTVRYFGARAEVLELNSAKNYARITVNGKTLSVRLSDLRPLGQGVSEGLNEMDKTQTSPGRDGDIDWTKKQIHLGPEHVIKAKDVAQHALKALDKTMKKSHADTSKKKGVAEGSIGQNVMQYPRGSVVADKHGNRYTVLGHQGRTLVVKGVVDGKRVMLFPHQLQQGVAEAGPFSYGKAPRKGSVADLAAKKRREQERGKQLIEPKDQQVGVAKVTKGVAEGRTKAEINFDIEDIKRLEQINNLESIKQQAFELISRPSAHPMKPEKVSWFRSALERMDSPMKVIKLMYDLYLSGEGKSVLGTRHSMDPNSYRRRFGESQADENPVADAIYRRLMNQKPDLFTRYGLEYVAQAVEDVADSVGRLGPDDEIGSSDVSGWVRQVEQNLRDRINQYDEPMTDIDRMEETHRPGHRDSSPKNTDDLIGGRYDPDEFDQMVLRLKQMAQKQERERGPVDLKDLARRLRGVSNA